MWAKAEELAQVALVGALAEWPRTGVPNNLPANSDYRPSRAVGMSRSSVRASASVEEWILRLARRL